MRGRHPGRRGAASSTAIRRGPAGSTCWRSTFWAWPAPAPFLPDDALRRSAPRRALCRAVARRISTTCWRFVENGGYALAAYERWRKLFRDAEGRMHVRSERIARQHRMNIGTIVEEPLLKVRCAGARRRCSARSRNISSTCSRPGDTFMFAGRLLRFLRLRETVVRGGRRRRRRAEGAGLCRRAHAADHQPRRPGARPCCRTPRPGAPFPSRCGNGWRCSRRAPACPAATTCWWRPFRAATAGSWSPTASRAATRTRPSGMLLTRRMERARHGAARLRRHRLRAGLLVGAASRPMWRGCSSRTCSATTWRPGWPKAPCCAAPSAMSR